jgi:lantibiotic modifying enzyme
MTTPVPTSSGIPPNVHYTHSGDLDLPFSREEIVQQAVSIAEYLYEQANWRQSEQLWSFASPRTTLFHPASFYGGATGIATYMCEVAHVTKDATYYRYAQTIMDWVLKHHPFVPGETPPGLYFGYAGVSWLLARLANALNDHFYLECAVTSASQLARTTPDRLDLTHGAAGLGLMHLELFRHTGDHTYLAYAQSLAHSLLEKVHIDEEGGVYWQEEQFSMWGLAHGSAGIAYFLLALYKLHPDPDLQKLLTRVNTTLLLAAVPTARGQGISWRKDTTDITAPWTHWCHGAAGVGTYLLAAARTLQEPTLETAAIKAAQAVRLSSGMTSLCQCHGFSGDGEYLLQVSRAFNVPEITRAVYQLVRKLYTFRLTTEGVPTFVWNSEAMHPDPDYMTGYCGIYGFLLRFCDETLPRPLSIETL